MPKVRIKSTNFLQPLTEREENKKIFNMCFLRCFIIVLIRLSKKLDLATQKFCIHIFYVRELLKILENRKTKNTSFFMNTKAYPQ